jgi:hypothetical protein
MEGNAPTDGCAQWVGAYSGREAARFLSLPRTPPQRRGSRRGGRKAGERREEKAVDRGERVLLLRLSLLLLQVLLLQSAHPPARSRAQRTRQSSACRGGLVGLGLIKWHGCAGMQQANKASCCALALRSDWWRSS